jgi:hypothetical protein
VEDRNRADPGGSHRLTQEEEPDVAARELVREPIGVDELFVPGQQVQLVEELR